jgi:hypothetical protein
MKGAKREKSPRSLHLTGTDSDRWEKSVKKPCKFLPIAGALH